MLKGVAVGALGVVGSALVPGVRGQDLSNEVTISGDGGTVEYAFAVSGAVEPASQADSEDRVSGNQVRGAVGDPGTDDFRFSGNITQFSANGSAVVTVNGEEVDDPTGLPGGGESTTTESGGSDGSGGGEPAAEAVGVVQQGGNCVPLVPLTDEGESSTEFYGYTDDENADVEPYEANTPGNIGKPDTSYVFLYEGGDGLSLVFIHGGGEKKQGGSASFDISGLPGGGDWVVMDDDYGGDPDTWNVGGNTATIDWSWNKYHGDGGVFSGLGSEFDVTIEAAFNGSAKLKPETPGQVKRWQAITVDGDGNRKAIDLSMDQPVTIKSGSC